MGKASRRKRKLRPFSYPYELSDALSALAEPIMAPGLPLEERCFRYTCALLAWNLALVPESRREPEFERMLYGGVESDQAGDTISTSGTVAVLPQNDALVAIIHFLVARKDSLYPRDRRLLASYDLMPTENGYQLSVRSVALPTRNARVQRSRRARSGLR